MKRSQGKRGLLTPLGASVLVDLDTQFYPLSNLNFDHWRPYYFLPGSGRLQGTLLRSRLGLGSPTRELKGICPCRLDVKTGPDCLSLVPAPLPK